MLLLKTDDFTEEEKFSTDILKWSTNCVSQVSAKVLYNLWWVDLNVRDVLLNKMFQMNSFAF